MASRPPGKNIATATKAGAVALTLGGHPHLAKALTLAGAAVGKFRDSRVERMWNHVVRGVDDPVAFTEKVEQALLEDGNEVTEGFVAAASAAASAISLSVVPSIGLLARRFLTEGVPHRRLYRAVLSVLQDLDDAEFGALRSALHTLSNVRADVDPFSTLLHRDTPGSQWEWFCRNTQPATMLATGDTAPFLVRAIAQVLDEPTPEQARTDARSANKPSLPRSLVNLLVSVMPFTA